MVHLTSKKKKAKQHKNIHNTVSWDVNNVKFNGKLTHTDIFFPLFVAGETTLCHAMYSTKGLLGREPTFSWRTNILFNNWDLFSMWDWRCSRTKVWHPGMPSFLNTTQNRLLSPSWPWPQEGCGLVSWTLKWPKQWQPSGWRGRF